MTEEREGRGDEALEEGLKKEERRMTNRLDVWNTDETGTIEREEDEKEVKIRRWMRTPLLLFF